MLHQFKENPLLDISRENMERLIFLKKQRQLKKNQPGFSCFVISQAQCDLFFKMLKNAMATFADGTRFQLIVHDTDFTRGHWFVIDCYIKDSILHTFILDAALKKGPKEVAIKVLNRYFPKEHGLHYALLKMHRGKEDRIQTSDEDCQTFAFEHASVLAKIDPANLYNSLQKYAIRGSEYAIPYICLKGIAPSLSLLAPIFRCMQSMVSLNNLPETFKSVVNSKGQTLTGWLAANNFLAREKKIKNYAIRYKAEKYLKQLENDESSSFNAFHFNWVGLGYVSLPRLAQTLSEIKLKDKGELSSFIQNLIDTINLAPKNRKMFNMFNVPAKHQKMINETLQHLSVVLKKIDNENSFDQLAYEFASIIYNYAGYLCYHNSDRTQALLHSYFDNLEKISSATRKQDA